MTSDVKTHAVFSQTRFLVVDANAKIGEGLRRFLLSEKSPAVHVAPSPVLGLRVLQDRKTPVDCVICAHRPGEFSGFEFLASLRAGRWGGLALQHIKFILLMASEDPQVTEAANSLGATGYIIGSLSKENVRGAILRALDPGESAQMPPNFKIAHMRAGEADLIVAPFPPSFGRLRSAQQQEALQAVVAAAQKARLSGTTIAIYADAKGETAFAAPAVFERFLSRLSIGTIDKFLNRDLYVEWVGGDPTVETEATDADTATDLLDELFAPTVLSAEEEATDRRRIASKGDNPFSRGLTDEDIRSVALAFKEMGAKEFVGKFVRHQSILLQDQSQPLIPTTREFYVSIELLRTTFFPGAEMRGSNRYFQSLTHLLDQLMLRSLPFLPGNDRPTSLNLNIHSILTKTFETALQTTRADLLTFEIPQPLIVSHFEEFKKARDVIVAHGGKIAVDQIFPDTMGALDLDAVRPNFAKLHWKGDLKKFKSTHHDFVKKTQDRGIEMVMSRVDDPAAFQIAQEFGIQRFQGFLIDEMAGAKPGNKTG